MINFCHMKQLTPTSERLHFLCFELMINGHFFHVLLTNEHSLTDYQIDCFALYYFLRHRLKLPSECCVFKIRQYIKHDFEFRFSVSFVSQYIC